MDSCEHIVLRVPTAEVSLPLMRARRIAGIATAAITAIIATTMSNSMSVKPFLMLLDSPKKNVTQWQSRKQVDALSCHSFPAVVKKKWHVPGISQRRRDTVLR
jgi:hypothetical protein